MQSDRLHRLHRVEADDYGNGHAHLNAHANVETDANDNTSDLGSSESSSNPNSNSSRPRYDRMTLAVLESKSTRERDPHRFVRGFTSSYSATEREREVPVASSNGMNGNGNVRESVQMRPKERSNSSYGDSMDSFQFSDDSEWRDSLSSWKHKRKQMLVTSLPPEVLSANSGSPLRGEEHCNGQLSQLSPTDSQNDASTFNKRHSRIRSFNEMLQNHSHAKTVFDNDGSHSADPQSDSLDSSLSLSASLNSVRKTLDVEELGSETDETKRSERTLPAAPVPLRSRSVASSNERNKDLLADGETNSENKQPHNRHLPVTESTAISSSSPLRTAPETETKVKAKVGESDVETIQRSETVTLQTAPIRKVLDDVSQVLSPTVGRHLPAPQPYKAPNCDAVSTANVPASSQVTHNSPSDSSEAVLANGPELKPKSDSAEVQPNSNGLASENKSATATLTLQPNPPSLPSTQTVLVNGNIALVHDARKRIRRPVATESAAETAAPPVTLVPAPPSIPPPPPLVRSTAKVQETTEDTRRDYALQEESAPPQIVPQTICLPPAVSALRKRPQRIDTPPPFAANRFAGTPPNHAAAKNPTEPNELNGSENETAELLAGNRGRIEPTSIGATVPNIGSGNTPKSETNIATTAVVVRQRQPLAGMRARHLQSTTASCGVAITPSSGPMPILPSQFFKPSAPTPHVANGDSNTSYNGDSNPVTENKSNGNVVTASHQVCGGCHQLLRAGSAMFIEQFKCMYHLNCFVCSSCRRSLLDANGVITNVFMYDQRLHCRDCSASSQPLTSYNDPKSSNSGELQAQVRSTAARPTFPTRTSVGQNQTDVFDSTSIASSTSRVLGTNSYV